MKAKRIVRISVRAGVVCSKLSATTDVTNITRSNDDDDDDDDDGDDDGGVIYCPMPFQPDSYSVCCLNDANQMRCCQEDVASSAHDLPYASHMTASNIADFYSAFS